MMANSYSLQSIAMSNWTHRQFCKPRCLSMSHLGLRSLGFRRSRCPSNGMATERVMHWRYVGLILYAVDNGRPDTSLKRIPRKKSEELTVPTDENYVKVEFKIRFKTDYGQSLKIVGGYLQFGSWSIARAPEMEWSDNDVWRLKLALPVGNLYEYKYVVVDSGGASVVHWQKGNNCVLAVGTTDTQMVVEDNWEGNPGAKVQSKGKGITTKEERLMDWASEVKSMSADNTALVLAHKKEMEKLHQENKAAKQEVSRMKSELRMASMTKQSAEQQVKELQQENRRLMSLLAEQQDIHESVMKKALSLLSDESEEDTGDERRQAGEKAVRSNGSIPPKGPKLRKQSAQRTKRRREATPDGTAPVC